MDSTVELGRFGPVGRSATLAPFGYGLWIDAVALGQGPQALLTTLYRSTDCLCRSGAAVKNLAQSASLHAGENDAPSKPGTKHLVRAIGTLRIGAYRHQLTFDFYEGVRRCASSEVRTNSGISGGSIYQILRVLDLVRCSQVRDLRISNKNSGDGIGNIAEQARRRESGCPSNESVL